MAQDTGALWSEKFELGIPVIDGQHRNLVNHMADLLEGIEQGKTEGVEPCLRFLRKYTIDHSRTEERFMAEHGFPGLGAHAAVHLLR